MNYKIEGHFYKHSTCKKLMPDPKDSREEYLILIEMLRDVKSRESHRLYTTLFNIMNDY